MNHKIEFWRKEQKPMSTRVYGDNQKMVAKFPGKCFLCTGKIIENADTIVPVLSERTPRGRHPWVHVQCMEKDTNKLASPGPRISVVEQPVEIQPVSRFLIDPPPVSQRQIEVVGKNLVAVLQALANNPNETYALVPNGKFSKDDAVVITESIPTPEQAEAASA